MSTHVKIDISNIQNFFDLILCERNASSEELYNFLQDCLKFVFAVNKIDINQYEIQFHTIKIADDDIFGAKMSQDMKKNNKFDVFFSQDDLVLKNLTTESIEHILTLMFMALHEFGHIIQFIKFQNIMDDYDKEHQIVYKNIGDIVKYQDRKSQNLITRQYLKHEEAKLLISVIERDASYQAYQYSKIIFNTLLEYEDDPIMQAFLKTGIKFNNKMRQDLYKKYRKADKENKEALRILNDYGIKEEDLLTY